MGTVQIEDFRKLHAAHFFASVKRPKVRVLQRRNVAVPIYEWAIQTGISCGAVLESLHAACAFIFGDIKTRLLLQTGQINKPFCSLGLYPLLRVALVLAVDRGGNHCDFR
jgi:hypothetical protein